VFLSLSLIYESLFLTTLLRERSLVPSRIEYLNTEEAAISSIAFPGKISQSLSNVSFFFVLMMEKNI